jgi:hypothetical protein
LRLRAARKHYQPIRDSGNNLRAHYAKHAAAQHDSLILAIMSSEVLRFHQMDQPMRVICPGPVLTVIAVI